MIILVVCIELELNVWRLTKWIVSGNHWPIYTSEGPQNMVFDANVTSHAEPDTYRAGGINYVMELMKARQGRNCSGLVACGYGSGN
jgi:hypothetical protein